MPVNGRDFPVCDATLSDKTRLSETARGCALVRASVPDNAIVPVNGRANVRALRASDPDSVIVSVSGRGRATGVVVRFSDSATVPDVGRESVAVVTTLPDRLIVSVIAGFSPTGPTVIDPEMSSESVSDAVGAAGPPAAGVSGGPIQNGHAGLGFRCGWAGPLNGGAGIF